MIGALCSAMPAALLAPAAFAQDAAAPEQTAPAGEAFSFDLLSERMQQASQSDPASPSQVQGFLAELGYDAYQRIRFDKDHARWADDEAARFRLHAFHLGWLFK